ncbi:DUF4091 domain-containing protein [bacterium]|nr:DUF4091 domain-containing protein [bacterium]
MNQKIKILVFGLMVLVSPMVGLSQPPARGNLPIKIWWRPATEKVFPDSKPRRSPEKISIAAAGNEFEAFQVVMRTDDHLKYVSIAMDKFKKAGTGTKMNGRTDICEVSFVDVSRPSDSDGRIGEWPDPLPLYDGPFDIPADRNKVLWIQVHIPANTAPGNYENRLHIFHGEAEKIIPIQLHVWNFSLPKIPSIRSAFKISAKTVARYHNISMRSPKIDTLLDYYHQNFRDHRISPYDPMSLHPAIKRIQKKKTGVNLRLDFKDFDRTARRNLNTFGFNSFKFNLEGFRKGSFFSRKKGKLADYAEGTPEYDKLFSSYLRQVTAHLKKKGWLDKAYVYWFDEPQERDMHFVAESNRTLRKLAPGLKIFLTQEPVSELIGQVDIWCVRPHTFDEKQVQLAQKRGEEVWSYLCTNPKAPYPTLFIDSPAINLRMWLWLSWKYQLDGILVWEATYWHSPAAYPKSAWQNPWRDPMAYRAGYGEKPGERGYWGNGDGRFIYPPNQDIMQDKQPYLTGPVNSIRWEMLREGIEDFEYFVLLEQKVNALKSKGASQNKIKPLEQLLEIPRSIAVDWTHFTSQGTRLERHRKKLAEGIESAQKQLNSIP